MLTPELRQRRLDHLELLGQLLLDAAKLVDLLLEAVHQLLDVEHLGHRRRVRFDFDGRKLGLELDDRCLLLLDRVPAFGQTRFIFLQRVANLFSIK